MQVVAVEASERSLQTDYILKVPLAKTSKFMHNLVLKADRNKILTESQY